MSDLRDIGTVDPARLAYCCGHDVVKLAREAIVERKEIGTGRLAEHTYLTERAFSVEEILHPAFRVRCGRCHRKHALVAMWPVLAALQVGDFFRRDDYAVFIGMPGRPESEKLAELFPKRDLSRKPGYKSPASSAAPHVQAPSSASVDVTGRERSRVH